MMRFYGTLYFFVTVYVGSYVFSLPQTGVCVIGAGYSGLAAARHLKQMGLNFIVFEATEDIGGTWRFDPHVGVDDYGVPVLSSQYKYLRTNSPRQLMEYGGYPFPDDTPSHPTGTCFFKYLKSFAKDFRLMDNIQVRSYVTLVKRVDNHWEVTYLKTDDSAGPTYYTVSCDFVIVASGRYKKANLPKFPGLNIFKGKYIHSHDYKDPEAYIGRQVLVVGAGVSGQDIVSHLQKTADKVVHSHHRKLAPQNFRNNYIQKPDVKTFVSNGVIFTDDTFEEVDDVIFCTGFGFDYSFLDKSVGVTTTKKFVLPLYQNIINIHHPSMMFVGITSKGILRSFEGQAEYAASSIAGKFKLPSQEQMLATLLQNVYGFLNRNMNIVNVHYLGFEMDSYFANLTVEAGIARIPPILSEISINKLLLDPLRSRDYDYEILDSHRYKIWYNGGGSRGLECPIKI